MKKTIGIIVILVAIIIAVLALQTHQEPDNVVTVEDTTNSEDQNTGENNENVEENDNTAEENTEEANTQEDVPGTDLAVANEENTEEEQNTASDEATVFTVEENATVARLGKKVGGQHDGTVNIQEGFLQIDNGTIVGGEFVIDMDTIVALDTDSQGLIDHLKGDDFFAVDQYPTATVNILDVTDGLTKANLTLNGVTKTISFPADITIDDNQVVVNAAFAIDRTMRDIPATPVVSNYMEISLNDLTFSNQ